MPVIEVKSGVKSSDRIAVSVSLGSSKRDCCTRIELLGRTIELHRLGTDGDFARFSSLFADLQGRVDAIGVGGASLNLWAGNRAYPFPRIQQAAAAAGSTPVVDGNGFRRVAEYGVARQLAARPECTGVPRRVLFASGIDRWHLSLGFVEAGFEYVFADAMFGLGVPLAIRRIETMRRWAPRILPLVRRIPLRYLYPVGRAQEVSTPRFRRWFEWAGILSGDCLYLKKYAPESLAGKIVVTNTTTQDDVEFFQTRGASSLVTTTPVLEGRSFGTNLMEAALVAASGLERPLRPEELARIYKDLRWSPSVRNLNPLPARLGLVS